MLGDVRGLPGVRRIGQVVAEGDLDPLPRPARADHHEAVVRVKAEQVRHDGQHVGR